MNAIHMIPIESLSHHPDNPRRNIGDIRELTASIRESGVMQNLTIVDNPNWKPGCDETVAEYWVVIGNRRLEAAKAVGLKELPCIISDMDYKSQLATMMAENMQRVDLTLAEQVQGVQMMMDLGMDAREISKSTGLRKDAIERRAVMAKYDAGKAAAAVVRGGTISDFMELEKLPEEHREAMLEHVGTPNLRARIRNKLDEIAQGQNKAALIAKLETFATRIDRQGYVGEKVVQMAYVESWWRFNKTAAEDLQVPADVRDVHYYWHMDSTGYLKLYREDHKSAADRAKAERELKMRAFFDAQKERAEKLDNDLRNMRYEWLMGGSELKYDAVALLKAYAVVLSEGTWRSSYSDAEKARVEELTGLTYKGSGYADRPKLEDLLGAIEAGRLMPVALGMIWGAIDRSNNRTFCWNWQEYRVEHQHSKEYEILYDLLTDLGYPMSDEEIAFMNGTHDVYRAWEEEME